MVEYWFRRYTHTRSNFFLLYCLCMQIHFMQNIYEFSVVTFLCHAINSKCVSKVYYDYNIVYGLSGVVSTFFLNLSSSSAKELTSPMSRLHLKMR